MSFLLNPHEACDFMNDWVKNIEKKKSSYWKKKMLKKFKEQLSLVEHLKATPEQCEELNAYLRYDRIELNEKTLNKLKDIWKEGIEYLNKLNF